MAAALTIFLLLFSFSLSTSITPFPTTLTVLNVTASLQQTLDILSFDPQTFHPFAEETIAHSSSNSSSLFSLPLLSRESLLKTQHKDYKSLLLSRLERDSVRVYFLVTKLRALPEDFSTPVVSGASQGSGEYFTRIGVGTPPKQFNMVLDTGSDVNWLQCKPCTNCYSQSDPIFDPAASSSYRPLSCNSPQCRSLRVSSCRSNRCLYQVSYGDGSFTVGDFVEETVSFGNSGSVPAVAIG